MREFKKKEKVCILDYPFGRPTNLTGVVMGIAHPAHYNILMDNGCNEGNLVKYKYWSLILDKGVTRG